MINGMLFGASMCHHTVVTGYRWCLPEALRPLSQVGSAFYAIPIIE